MAAPSAASIPARPRGIALAASPISRLGANRICPAPSTKLPFQRSLEAQVRNGEIVFSILVEVASRYGLHVILERQAVHGKRSRGASRRAQVHQILAAQRHRSGSDVLWPSPSKSPSANESYKKFPGLSAGSCRMRHPAGPDSEKPPHPWDLAYSARPCAGPPTRATRSGRPSPFQSTARMARDENTEELAVSGPSLGSSSKNCLGHRPTAPISPGSEQPAPNPCVRRLKSATSISP